jgi:hypothetical protein
MLAFLMPELLLTLLAPLFQDPGHRFAGAKQ